MNIGPIIRAMSHNRTRVVLIVLEIAMTLAIVTNCVNVILAERARMSQKSGFDDGNIVWMNIRPFAPEFRDAAFLDNIIDADVRTISSIPGVRAVANTSFEPWESGGSSTGVIPVGDSREPIETQIYYGTKDLIQTLGGHMIEGRAFRDGDHGAGHVEDPLKVVILSKTAADVLFPGGHALGKSITEAVRAHEPIGNPMIVVGIIGEFYSPMGRPSAPRQGVSQRVIFLPARVGGYTRGMSYLIRVEPGAMSSVIAQVEKRLTAANSGRVFNFKTTADKKSGFFASSKIVVTTMTCIIVTLVGITALGLLGLTSLSVAERTKQIGTRRALGATRSNILAYFVIENWLLTTAGLILGVAGAYALNFLLVSHVSDVKMQWQLIVGGMLLLWINCFLSTILPAMRAMAVPPSIATRSV
jgi:putative ABC transport system permease protein